MVRIGLVGLGFMGQNHFNVYKGVDGAEVVSVCDKIAERAAPEVPAIGGNIGEAKPLDLSEQARYMCFDEMLGTGGFDAVDICTPTYLHSEMTVKALEAGYHVICEKPMARTVEQCDRMIAASEATDKLLFIAQCVRFWPEYMVLARMIESGELGEVKAARFARMSATPTWASEGWLMNSELSGGALLDLHIHDVDYMLSVFGMPNAVLARAMNIPGSGSPTDHVETTYLYDELVCNVMGGWAMPASFPFEQHFQVVGTKGLLNLTLTRDPVLCFYPVDGEPYTPEYEGPDGYYQELTYFTECIATGTAPERVPPQAARESVRVIMAEAESIERREPVSIG